MVSSQYLQFCSQTEIEKLILDENALILRKYLSERELIPKGNLVEIGFEELDNAPMETMTTIYKELGLEGFEEARPGMEAYLDSVKKYKRNTYHPIPRTHLDMIHMKWDFWFKEFAYNQRR